MAMKPSASCPTSMKRPMVVCARERIRNVLGLQPRRQIGQSGGVEWVAIECEFQCRACGHLSPLNQLDVDGSVRCLLCGLDQAFAQSSWRLALDAAHALADLGGAGAEGQHPHPALSIAAENPHLSARTATHTQSGIVIERGMQVP